jgi:hypothetical protein
MRMSLRRTVVATAAAVMALAAYGPAAHPSAAVRFSASAVPDNTGWQLVPGSAPTDGSPGNTGWQ